jgi:polysaccharide chain length determinant protein (PEP-CTERM system associated)
MSELKYYFSIFLRRLHYFLIISVILSAVSVIAAFALPPAYESQTRLLLEGPQIPSELASSTVTVGLAEQLEIIEQRLITRANMLDVARRQNAFVEIGSMTADEIVEAMRARTKLEKGGTTRHPTPILTITFEARSPAIAAGVLNEYLTLIERQNTEFRTTRAGNTLDFFQQEVNRLGQDLDRQSARILDFKTENAEALPESLQYRLDQQGKLQDLVRQIDQDVTTLHNQRSWLIDIFNATGQVTDTQATAALSPEEKRLENLQAQLDQALSIYSESSPRVKMLQAQVAQIQERLANAPEKKPSETTKNNPEERPGAATLDLRLKEIDTRISMLQQQRNETEERLTVLSESLAKTPGNTVALDELTRAYANIEQQYNTAVDRLAQASTGERIESLSRGQRISIIEPPATPDQPTKPNRILIAGGGTVFGIVAGIAAVVLFELLNHTARRPEDIIKRIGVRPLATIPYRRSRTEIFRKRLVKLVIYLLILVGLPAAVYSIHLYYLPLDLLADRFMNKIGVRW